MICWGFFGGRWEWISHCKGPQKSWNGSFTQYILNQLKSSWSKFDCAFSGFCLQENESKSAFTDNFSHAGTCWHLFVSTVNTTDNCLHQKGHLSCMIHAVAFKGFFFVVVVAEFVSPHKRHQPKTMRSSPFSVLAASVPPTLLVILIKQLHKHGFRRDQYWPNNKSICPFFQIRWGQSDNNIWVTVGQGDEGGYQR